MADFNISLKEDNEKLLGSSKFHESARENSGVPFFFLSDYPSKV